MPETNYIKITVGDFEIQTTDPNEIPISISYSLENEDDYQRKTSGQAFDIVTPATLNNTKASNTFNNPSVEDLTEGQIFKNYQPAKIEVAGEELLVGKGILKKASHNSRPIQYVWNIHGDNADWIIDLKELTLFEVLKHITFIYSKSTMEASWSFDGTNENLPYVFAPVRYREPFAGYIIENEKLVAQDDDVKTTYMKPSLSKYWIIYWAFKSIGYKIQSNFFNTSYFRRMVTPWTWGNFLNSEGTRLDIHKFLAKSTQDVFYDASNGGNEFIWDVKVSNDSTDGAFDNNNDYTYNTSTFEMLWEYKTPHFGILEANFSMSIYYSFLCTGNSRASLYVQWFKNGVRFSGLNGSNSGRGNLIATHDSSGVGGTNAGNQEMFATATVAPGDKISAKIFLYAYESKIGTCRISSNILQFKLDYFKIPLGGSIDFENYTGFKKHKFLDFFAGECDLYDLSFKTDSINKVLYIEPTHAYSLTNDLSQTNEGFFVDDFIDWNSKGDFSKEWEMTLYSQGEREQIFKFKDDGDDGLLKVVQNRHLITLGAGKYVLPERFKAGPKERANRFYSATMHYDVDQFKALGTGLNSGISPQMICIVPENISNTSNSESGNTFIPKSAYYKGLITGVGAWRWDGTVRQDYPYMFAVNYKDGGENDPILSYSDEKIKSGSGFVIGKGLLKRFLWQRMVIMRNGQRYLVFMRLKNSDVSGKLHREFKILNGHRWELINIDGYRPLKDESTACMLQKWVPILESDLTCTFPSADSVLNSNPTLVSLDMKYNQLKCLKSDIPL